jgi:uncharacterized protein
MEKVRWMSSTRRPDPKRPSSADALTFNVTGLLAEPAGSIRDMDVASGPLDLGPDLRQRRGVSGRLRLTRTNRGLLVQGKFETSIDQECSRCLREIDFPLQLELEEEALPSIDLASGLPLDSTAEPDVLRLNDHHELELENEVREAIMLSEPIAPLCRPDCPGLCPICGQELATGPHDHEEAEVDPRLEGLRDFKPTREG